VRSEHELGIFTTAISTSGKFPSNLSVATQGAVVNLRVQRFRSKLELCIPSGVVDFAISQCRSRKNNFFYQYLFDLNFKRPFSSTQLIICAAG
jgi:hypothetical protein